MSDAEICQTKKTYHQSAGYVMRERKFNVHETVHLLWLTELWSSFLRLVLLIFYLNLVSEVVYKLFYIKFIFIWTHGHCVVRIRHWQSVGKCMNESRSAVNLKSISNYWFSFVFAFGSVVKREYIHRTVGLNPSGETYQDKCVCN